jgi:4-hydroxy-tetrahydrodipicolinate synthase
MWKISAQRSVCEYILKRDLCDSVIVAGTNGEFASLTSEERLTIFEVVRECVQNRPVIAGTGSPSTRETIYFTKQAEAMGMDMAMVVSPYFNNPDRLGMFEHFKATAESTKLPITLYNIPLFTGVNLDSKIVGELARIDNIVAIKEEVALNPTQVTRFILATDNNFPGYCGDDTMVLSALSQGAVGAVSGGSHLIGRDMKRMIELFIGGKVSETQEIHHRIFPLFRAFSGKGRLNPVPLLKEAVSHIGVRVGPPRLPLRKVDEEERKRMKQVLKNLGIL